MLRCGRSLVVIAAVGALVAGLGASAPARASTTLNLLDGTNVLASKTGSGPLSSTSSSTNTFSPAAYADYKRFGGEPTATVDRVPLTSGAVASASVRSVGSDRGQRPPAQPTSAAEAWPGRP